MIKGNETADAINAKFQHYIKYIKDRTYFFYLLAFNASCVYQMQHLIADLKPTRPRASGITWSVAVMRRRRTLKIVVGDSGIFRCGYYHSMLKERTSFTWLVLSTAFVQRLITNITYIHIVCLSCTILQCQYV